MPLISAWQCPETRSVFVEKPDYLTHLRGLAQQRLTRRKNARLIAANQSRLDEFHLCGSVDDMLDWIEANPEVFYINAATRMHPFIADDVDPTGFRIFDLRVVRSFEWTDGPTCHHTPRGVPAASGGWSGQRMAREHGCWAPQFPTTHLRLEFSYTSPTLLPQNKDRPYPCVFDFFKGTNFQSGGGSGLGTKQPGISRMSQDIVLFHRDWVPMTVINKLKAA